MTIPPTSARLSPSARRARRHVALAVATLAGTMLFAWLLASDDMVFRLSMATAYVSLALLVACLMVGPLNVLRGRPNPVNTNLRRDLGIWGGTLGLAHVALGLQVHLRGRMWLYFVNDPKEGARLPIRLDVFGGANYLGLAATLLLALLLALSNDASLRRLGTTRWKQLQRLNYFCMLAIVVHGVLYQIIENRPLPLVALLAVAVAAGVALQLAGWGRRRAHVGTRATSRQVS